MEEISNNNYNNFNIELKEPKHITTFHNSFITCATVLNDSRLATGSDDNSIIIYNNKTFKPDLTIREHMDSVTSLIQLSSGILCSGSKDKKIKFYNINGNTYNILQTILFHTDGVGKIIELSNHKLVSSSKDGSIIFYFKDNSGYKKDFNIKINPYNGPIIQTKSNEICYYEVPNYVLNFFNFQERKNIAKINDISVTNYIFDSLLMMSKDLLLAAGVQNLTIINVNSHSIIRIIEVYGPRTQFDPSENGINALCLLTENIILSVDDKYKIIQWKIEGDNLCLTSKKEYAHESSIRTVKKIGNGLIMTGDLKGVVKIW